MNVLLGNDDVLILRAIKFGLSDISAIHTISGVPIPCIERRIPAYLDLGLVEQTETGFMLSLAGEMEIELDPN